MLDIKKFMRTKKAKIRNNKSDFSKKKLVFYDKITLGTWGIILEPFFHFSKKSKKSDFSKFELFAIFEEIRPWDHQNRIPRPQDYRNSTRDAEQYMVCI